MKIAYLILAHDNPNHLRRLVGVLSSASSAFFIHVDKKTGLGVFSPIESEQVHVSPLRVPVYWGSFSFVEAILVLIREALADPRHFTRFVLLSGTDYPLRSTAYIEHFFRCNPRLEFMNVVKMPSDAAGKPISRLTRYRPSPDAPAAARLTRYALTKIGVIPGSRAYKPSLGTRLPYAGSTWWALSRAACRFIQTIVDTETAFVDFFKNTHCPDEMFFQTILVNSPFKPYIRRNVTYTDWSAGGPSPALLNTNHIAFFRSTSTFASDGIYGAGEMLFARKCSDAQEQVVSALDQLIRERDDMKPYDDRSRGTPCR